MIRKHKDMSEEVKDKKQCAGDPGAGQTEKKPDIHSGEGREESLKKEHTADTAKDSGNVNEPETEKAGGSAKAAQAETPDAGDAAGGKQTETAEGSGSDKDSAESKPDKKDQKIAELNDKYLRLFAEFDNFRKRSENEKAAMFAEGEKTVLLTVLPLIDNFERALDSIPEEDKDSPFAEGIRKVYKAFTDQLKELGVTHIEAVGKEFDANFHNAVMHVDDENEKENVIVEEFQKGYMFGDKVLRYSMVKVAN